MGIAAMFPDIPDKTFDGVAPRSTAILALIAYIFSAFFFLPTSQVNIGAYGQNGLCAASFSSFDGKASGRQKSSSHSDHNCCILCDTAICNAAPGRVDAEAAFFISYHTGCVVAEGPARRHDPGVSPHSPRAPPRVVSGT